MTRRQILDALAAGRLTTDNAEALLNQPHIARSPLLGVEGAMADQFGRGSADTSTHAYGRRWQW